MDATVNMQADIDAINRGEARKVGNLWTIHGRTYQVEASGHPWPVSGPGFHSLDRGAFLVLGIYNEYGLSETAERLLDLERVSDAARSEACRVWQVGRGVS